MIVQSDYRHVDWPLGRNVPALSARRWMPFAILAAATECMPARATTAADRAKKRIIVVEETYGASRGRYAAMQLAKEHAGPTGLVRGVAWVSEAPTSGDAGSTGK